MVEKVEVPVKIHLAGQGRKYLSKDRKEWYPIVKSINRAPDWDAMSSTVVLVIARLSKMGYRQCVTYTSVLGYFIMQEEQGKHFTQSKVLLMLFQRGKGKVLEKMSTGNLDCLMAV